MPQYNVSLSVINRLPRYYRFLSELIKDNVERTSSGELAKKMGLTASQIRQDFNCFGGFGQQGYGYNVSQLHAEISEILGLNSHFKAIIVGAGNLGRAIANHMVFDRKGFNIIGVFDEKEALAGQLIKGQPIRHISGLDEFCKEFKPEVAVLCVPFASAKQLTDQLVELGISGFWNFSHYDMGVDYPDITVENVHLNDSLMAFCYKMNESVRQDEKKQQNH